MNPRLPSRRALLISGAAAVIARPSWPRDDDLPYAILQDFGKITSQDGKITLDLPTHSDAGTSVPLTVTADSPMTPDDYPKSIGLYSSGTPRPRICTLHFTHLGLPVFTTRIRLNGAQDVVAVIETSKGEFWRAQSHVTVTFGACATAAAGDALPPDWQPAIKIAVPQNAKAGDIITIRTVITHPMETGLRLDEFNAYVPLRIIQHFTCTFDGAPLFDMKLEPAIANNPSITFQMRALRSGVLVFAWQDSNGVVYTRTAQLNLVTP